MGYRINENITVHVKRNGTAGWTKHRTTKPHLFDSPSNTDGDCLVFRKHGWTMRIDDRLVKRTHIEFGCHCGTEYRDLPYGYIHWLLKQDIDNELKDNLTTALANKPRETAEQSRLRRKFERR